MLLIKIIIKASVLALGSLAYYGHEWAFSLFLIVTVWQILLDIFFALVAGSTEKKKGGREP